MIYDPRSCYQHIITELNKRALKYSIHEFPSGAIMIDIWYNESFFVVQIEEKMIGLSEVSDENLGFDTVPDMKFLCTEEFMTKLKSVLS